MIHLTILCLVVANYVPLCAIFMVDSYAGFANILWVSMVEVIFKLLLPFRVLIYYFFFWVEEYSCNSNAFCSLKPPPKCIFSLHNMYQPFYPSLVLWTSTIHFLFLLRFWLSLQIGGCAKYYPFSLSFDFDYPYK